MKKKIIYSRTDVCKYVSFRVGILFSTSHERLFSSHTFLLRVIYLYVCNYVYSIYTFLECHCLTSPPLHKERVKGNLSLLEPVFESDSLPVCDFRAVELSDSCRLVAVRQKYKGDSQSLLRANVS